MKPIYTVVRYYRKPYPSGNRCPRYSVIYKGKKMIEKRLNSQSITYDDDGNRIKGYACADNVVHDLRESGKEWDEILDIGEDELTVSAFKQYERMFKAAWDGAEK